jgi:hypothetical protein
MEYIHNNDLKIDETGSWKYMFESRPVIDTVLMCMQSMTAEKYPHH